MCDPLYRELLVESPFYKFELTGVKVLRWTVFELKILFYEVSKRLPKGHPLEVTSVTARSSMSHPFIRTVRSVKVRMSSSALFLEWFEMDSPIILTKCQILKTTLSEMLIFGPEFALLIPSKFCSTFKLFKLDQKCKFDQFETGPKLQFDT